MLLNSFISLDVETTGLSPLEDEIIEIAAIKFVNGEIADEFVTLIRPKSSIPAKITEITGITNSMVSNAPPMEAIISDFVKFCAGETIVAHNADFDMGFINAACEKCGLKFENKVLCTLKLSRQKLNLTNNKLATVAAYFGLESNGFHRAKADATACGEIFWHLSNMNTMMTEFTLIPGGLQVDQLQIEDSTLTVTQLNQYIKNLIESDATLFNVSVIGEISNFKGHYSGHLYLSLKDAQTSSQGSASQTSAIRAVMFKGAASKLQFTPENGMKVVATGRVSVYEATGQYQLYIENLTPHGAGDLAVAYEQLKKKLELEGLFAEERKKPIPKFPRKVGIVTSPTGSVIRDIINVATRRFPACELILYPAKVQGEGASNEIAESIQYFNEHTDVSILIVGRGGGSIEDLWAFNEELTARAIAASKIPIISAVGHETDVTIADFVADLRAPTPSAAAELAVPNADEIKNTLKMNYKRTYNALKMYLENKHQLINQFTLKSPIDLINTHSLKLDALYDKLETIISKNATEKKNKVAVLAGKLNALSPLEVLNRGYTVTTNVDGKPLKECRIGDKIITKTSNLKIISNIEEVEVQNA